MCVSLEFTLSIPSFGLGFHIEPLMKSDLHTLSIPSFGLEHQQRHPAAERHAYFQFPLLGLNPDAAEHMRQFVGFQFPLLGLVIRSPLPILLSVLFQFPLLGLMF